MTYRHLTDLADVLRTTGRRVVELPGWKSNGRPPSTGGFDPIGNLWHHTGAYDDLADATDDLSYAKWLAFTGRPSDGLPAPLCQVSISAEGVYYVCAAGRANHAGKARASGPIPAGDGNALLLGWECMNSGTQGWGEEQLDAMIAGAAATSKHYGWSASANRGHRETSVSGKWDPGRLDLDRFRSQIAARIIHQEDDMFEDKDRKTLTAVKADVDKLAGAVAQLDKRMANAAKRDKELRTMVRHRLPKEHAAIVEQILDEVTDEEPT